MKIEQITVTRTMQVRQYEPLQMSATATLGEDDNAQAALGLLYNVVLAALERALHPLDYPPASGQGDDLDAGF